LQVTIITVMKFTFMAPSISGKSRVMKHLAGRLIENGGAGAAPVLRCGGSRREKPYPTTGEWRPDRRDTALRRRMGVKIAFKDRLARSN